MMFDTVIMVDWSAASVPRLGRDSIWLCRRDIAGEALLNAPTRHAARVLLAEWLAAAREQNHRVLLGFDFPFGYPAGFAARLGLSGLPWRSVWDEIASLVEDDENNRNNRFDVAEALNRRISGSGFPFWGCPAAPARTHLQGKHHRRHHSDGLAERRIVDLYIPSAQPCWKLLGVGSVGGQALTGIPVARALRDDPRWCDQAQVWPFESGLNPPPEAPIVMAEVYPSLWAVERGPEETKDAAQVRAVAGYLAARDRAGELAALFVGDPRLSSTQRDVVEREEAWTLGVTAARQRPISVTGVAPHPPAGRVPPSPRPRGEGRGEGPPRRYDYLRDPGAISRRSSALVRAEAGLTRFPRLLRRVAARIAHAAGDVAILDDLAWSSKAAAVGQAALLAGAPILVDTTMVAAGISRERLPAANEILCFLRDPAVAGLAAEQRTTRSAAAVELWRGHLAGAVVAIGNAPTALFRLLEILAEGAARPPLILGFPVGFVGAAEAKAALAGFGQGIEFITLHGRRGGSAIAAAAVNALASRR
jgi:precorrin-8X/cobalt-precorrin-8 methylmutase